MMLTKSKALPASRLFAIWEIRTANAPIAGPRKALASGPKNWNKVKNWFDAPVSAEKFICAPTKARTANRKMNAILLIEKKFYMVSPQRKL